MMRARHVHKCSEARTGKRLASPAVSIISSSLLSSRKLSCVLLILLVAVTVIQQKQLHHQKIPHGHLRLASGAVVHALTIQRPITATRYQYSGYYRIYSVLCTATSRTQPILTRSSFLELYSNGRDDSGGVDKEGRKSRQNSGRDTSLESKSERYTVYHDQRLNYSIHRVDSRERVLDLLVFRHNVTTVDEFISKNPEKYKKNNDNDECDGGDDHMRSDALRYLTRFYDDNGQDLTYASSPVATEIATSSDDLAQFIVVWHGPTDSLVDETELTRTNGVVGSVDARRMSLDTIEKGMESTLGDLVLHHSNKRNKNKNMVVVELKNLRVHPTMRRQGIGRALVETVQNYSLSIQQHQHEAQQEQNGLPTSNEVIVFLQVDPDNSAAQRLYELTGFVWTRKDVGRMDWQPTN